MKINIFETPIYRHYKAKRDAGVRHETYVILYEFAESELARQLIRAYALEKRVDAASAAGGVKNG